MYSKFTKIIQKKKVSQSTRNALKRVEMQKNCYPFDPLRAKPERRSVTLPTPCHFKGSKECPCQFHADQTKTRQERGSYI